MWRKCCILTQPSAHQQGLSLVRTKLEKTSQRSISKTSKQQHVSVRGKTKQKHCPALVITDLTVQCNQLSVTLLTRQTLPLPGLQQDGPFSVQVSWLAALTQVGLGNVLPVNAHAVYVLPGTGRGTPRTTFKHTHTRADIKGRRTGSD